MLNLYNYTLGPILLAQGKWLRRTAIRLPEAAGPRDGTVGSESELPPVRLLFVGDSSAAGVGVPHQHQALAPQAASLLSSRLGRSVQWQLVARSGVNTSEVLSLVARHELRPADLLITSLGTNDVTSQRKPGQFLADYRALMAHLSERVGAKLAVITGLPPLHVLPAAPHPLRWYLGRYARRLDADLRAWIATKAQFAYVSLQWAAVPHEMAVDRYHPGPTQYVRWSQLVADRAVELLGCPSRSCGPTAGDA